MKAMSLTNHAIVRAIQRGISDDDLSLIMLIGTEVADGFFVRNKDCEATERHLRHLADRVRRLKGKRMVVAEDRIVTTYHASHKTERRLLRRAEQRNFAG